MPPLTWRQLHGVNELLRDSVEAATNAVAGADRDFARVPYAVLKQIPITAEAAGTVEAIHQAISTGVYGGILAISRLTAKTTTRVIDWMEGPEARAELGRIDEHQGKPEDGTLA